VHTPISEKNPYGPTRYGYLWEQLAARTPISRHLDFGTYDGSVPATLVRMGVVHHAVGVDLVDSVRIYEQSHKEAAPAMVDLVTLRGKKLPYPDSYFDSVSLLDVLEHVASQELLLKEVSRVLTPGGVIVVTVPRRHIFSFLDTGNWKFVFPGLHRWYYTRRYSRGKYYDRYVDPSNGLIGDIEVEKRWHEHFTSSHLSVLLRDVGLEPVDEDGAGLFARPFEILTYTIPALRRPLERIVRWDAQHFGATHLWMTAEKIG
jgi:SAM-dependent methyltransferase